MFVQTIDSGPNQPDISRAVLIKQLLKSLRPSSRGSYTPLFNYELWHGEGNFTGN